MRIVRTAMKNPRPLLLLAFSLFLLSSPALSQPTQQCQDLRRQLVDIRLKLDAIDRQADAAEVAQEKAQALADTLAAAKAALDAAAGDADKVASKFTELLETVDKVHPDLDTFLGETAAGSEQFKDSLEKTSTNINRARKLLQAGIDASKANSKNSGAQALKAFSDYYQALLEPLSPLVDKVPGVGAFLTAYGEAINSAAVITGQLEAEVERRRKIGKEITGRDFYSFAKSMEGEYAKLSDEYDRVSEQLDRLECDKVERQPTDNETIEVTDEQRQICIKKIGAPSDFFRQLTRRQRALDAANNQLNLDKLALRLARSEAADVRFHVKRLETGIQSQKDLMKRELQGIKNYLTTLNPGVRPSLQPPEFSPGLTNAYCSKIFALGQYERHRPTLKRYCDNALQRVKDEKWLNERKQELSEATKAVDIARQKLAETEKALSAAERRNQQAKNWDNAYLDCIKKQKNAAKSCRQITLGAKPQACRCDSINTASSVWGSYYYTSDSSICTAAQHAGAIAAAGDVVVVKQLPGREVYNGSTRNGIASIDYGFYKSSYVFLGVDLPPEAVEGELCPRYMKSITAPVTCMCRRSSAKGVVYGSDPYTADSSICAAARHSGAVESNGGLIRVIPSDGLKKYPGSTRNGIETNSWGEYPNSFVVQSVSQSAK